MKSKSPRARLDTISKSVSMGLLCLPIGILAGVYVWMVAIGSGYWVFLGAAPLSAFICGTCSWWVVMRISNRPSVAFGALCGCLAAILSHFLCWYTLLVSAFICHSITGGCTGSLGGPPVNPFQGLIAAGVYGIWSLLFPGWITVPAGALAGGLLAGFHARRKTMN